MNDNNYNPNEIESKWYKKWECSGVFDSIPNKQKAFTITMPPPNVTGVLHMGHILNNTIQDAFIRYARMKNYNACWLPGMGLERKTWRDNFKTIKIFGSIM